MLILVVTGPCYLPYPSYPLIPFQFLSCPVLFPLTPTYPSFYVSLYPPLSIPVLLLSLPLLSLPSPTLYCQEPEFFHPRAFAIASSLSLLSGFLLSPVLLLLPTRPRAPFPAVGHSLSIPYALPVLPVAATSACGAAIM